MTLAKLTAVVAEVLVEITTRSAPTIVTITIAMTIAVLVADTVVVAVIAVAMIAQIAGGVTLVPALVAGIVALALALAPGQFTALQPLLVRPVVGTEETPLPRMATAVLNHLVLRERCLVGRQILTKVAAPDLLPATGNRGVAQVCSSLG